MKTIVSIIVLFALCTILRADEALHHIELKSCANFEVISPLGIISVFPVSERIDAGWFDLKCGGPRRGQPR